MSTRNPVNWAAVIALVRICSSFGPSVVRPVVHVWVTRIESRPARRALSISSFAKSGSCCFATSSAAPTSSAGPPAEAAPVQAQKTSKTTQMARTSAQTSAWVRWLRDGRRPHREPVEARAAASGGLPVPQRAGRGALRGQGEIAATARALLLPGGLERHATRHPPHGWARRDDRDDRHSDRGGGAASRAEPRQAAQAAVQRAPARRQVVSLYRGHGRGRLSARDVHARAPPPRRRLLRPVREREEGARDPRRPQPRVPLPAV